MVINFGQRGTYIKVQKYITKNIPLGEPATQLAPDQSQGLPGIKGALGDTGGSARKNLLGK